jgi:hypothetical protein
MFLGRKGCCVLSFAVADDDFDDDEPSIGWKNKKKKTIPLLSE